LDLETKVAAAGFAILRRTSFFAVTLPLLAASRLRRCRGRAFDPSAELQIPTVVNSILRALLGLEGLIIKLGASLPFGSSLIVIARRPTAS
jgi:hypothetical protein